jgi:hypothetical protein
MNYKVFKECPYCNKELDGVENSNHIRWCNVTETIDHSKIQELHEAGFNNKEISDKLGCSYNVVRRSFDKGFSVKNTIIKRTHSQETKDTISKKRKEYLRNNPDKHIWKRKEKFISVPCEIVKNFFDINQISFVEEYSPLDDRHYSIDIAFPNEKIGIEINGNQHYNNDGTLKDYYQERKDLIESKGWSLYDIHYSFAFDNVKLYELVNALKYKYNLGSIDYSFYIKEKKIKNLKEGTCDNCGISILKSSDKCKKCDSISKRKFDITKNELNELVWSIPTSKIAKKFGVSDNTISKRCKLLGIDKPPRGYWRKLECSNEQLTGPEKVSLD